MNSEDVLSLKPRAFCYETSCLFKAKSLSEMGGLYCYSLPGCYEDLILNHAKRNSKAMK